eukprot:633968-Rhodomonas_salina.1
MSHPNLMQRSKGSDAEGLRVVAGGVRFRAEPDLHAVRAQSRVVVATACRATARGSHLPCFCFCFCFCFSLPASLPPSLSGN